MFNPSLKSIAAYVPKNCIDNFYFEKILDTTNEWIIDRTGIKTRYFADKNERSSDLGVEAAKTAISRANISPKDIDLVITATLSPDFHGMPSTATIIAQKLGLNNVPSFDISAACTGFIYLLDISSAFIRSGTYKNILIIGAEKISSILDFSDRSTCILFGDGAGAAIIGTTDTKELSILDVHISSGDGSELLHTPNDTKLLQMRGNEIFKIAVRTLISDVAHMLKANDKNPSDIDFFIPHQANLRIIKAVEKQLDFTPSQSVITVQKYGNTSAASIPMAINEIYETGKLKKGHLMLLDAFGGGLTWGSALLHFDGN
ncbi:MAG: beta-ketoacyl-ACP synthase III [Helicobacter sp.]|nr:beta-ketoacyl-ACP synthase III [Helicobacter sp.]